MTVGPPEPFTPSDSAAHDDSPAYAAFQVTIVNGSDANYDPVAFGATVQSTNVEGSQVFDSAQGYEGPPMTPVLPGRESTFRIAFGVADPADIVMQVSPGFEYEPVIYTTG